MNSFKWIFWAKKNAFIAHFFTNPISWQFKNKNHVIFRFCSYPRVIQVNWDTPSIYVTLSYIGLKSFVFPHKRSHSSKLGYPQYLKLFYIGYKILIYHSCIYRSFFVLLILPSMSVQVEWTKGKSFSYLYIN